LSAYEPELLPALRNSPELKRIRFANEPPATDHSTSA
jgi:hypothetical protein